jgi:hypothetical protein
MEVTALKIIAGKPSLPTLWVDTAIGIKLAKLRKQELIQEIEKQRVVQLKETVVELGRGGKLLCPKGEQEFEYWGERLDDDISREFAQLSRGIQLLPRQSVQDSQMFIAMEAYVRRDSEVHLPSSIYFHRDPIMQLRKIAGQSAFASVHGLPPTLLEMGKDARKEAYARSEELRCSNVAKGRTYAEQLLLEQRSFVVAIIHFAKSFRSRFVKGDFEPWELLTFYGYERYFSKWYSLTNKWADWEGLCAFLESGYFFDLPIVRIRCQLHAKLVTDKRPIEFGDSMDVNHLSVAIPMAHFVLTDRKMANRIISLGIDKDWNTAVYSEATIDKLFVALKDM